MPIAYKMCKVKKSCPGKLFPLFVLTQQEIPMRQWLVAKCGEKTGEKVKSKLGPLAFRPAWHLTEIPLATHIGIKGKSGKIEYMNPEYVWCEVEYKDEIDYQPIANQKGTINGKFVSKKAYLDYVPVNGFYKYKTNPNMFGEWILAGDMKINKVLSDKEVNDILTSNGYTPMPRYGGDINLNEYGF